MCRYKLQVFDTKRGDKEKITFFGFQSFWIPFFLVSKSTLYQGFLKGIIDFLYAKNLRYTEIYTIDLRLIEVKLIEK